MKLHRLEARQLLPVSVSEAWDFFSDAANLPRITPPWLGFTVTSELPSRMHPGMIATYTVRPFPGARVRWVTEITHVEAPHLFVDEQRFGPYRFWHHQHHFAEAPGGVEVRDVVHYALPLNPASAPIRRWMVAPRLRGIFEFRRRTLEGIFGRMELAGPGSENPM
ncbi:MAG TPA: SRPBCC family protein [Longimicrobiaceae bacterium]|nr:SRPBCC family protein [Longimicrobiaceae bacterium]